MNDAKRRPGTVYVGTVPAGTVLTHAMILDLVEKMPRESFDLELKAEEPRPLLPTPP